MSHTRMGQYMHMGQNNYIPWRVTDIPGAALEKRDPESLKVAELKFWLRCQGETGLSKLKNKVGFYILAA